MHFPLSCWVVTHFAGILQVKLFLALAGFFPARCGFAKQKQLSVELCGCSYGKSCLSPSCRASALGRSSQDNPRGLGDTRPAPAGHWGRLSMEEQGWETSEERHEPRHLRGSISCTHLGIPLVLISILPALVIGNLGPLAPNEVLPAAQGLCVAVSSHSHIPLLSPTSHHLLEQLLLL